MRIRPASAAAAFALSTLAFTGLAAPASAQTPVCDPYSQSCPTPPPPNEERPTTQERETCFERITTETLADGTQISSYTELSGDECATSTNTALPFTGGELVTMTAVGAGALAAGVVLVAAGRRRRTDVA